MLKIRVKSKRLGTIDIPLEKALEQGGDAAFLEVKKRVQSKHIAVTGERIPEHRVRAYPPRERYVRDPDKVDPRKAGVVSGDIFQQLRLLGGLSRNVDEYERQDLRGGNPVYFTQGEGSGDLWGFNWPTREKFLRDQGSDLQVTLKRSGKLWGSKKKITAKALKGAKKATLSIGFKGRRPRGDAVWVAREMRGKTKTGKQKKPSAAEVVAVMNSRDRQGRIGKPADPSGKTELGPSARLVPIGDAAAVRFIGLTEHELERTILASIRRAFLGIVDTGKMTVTIMDGK